MQQSSTPSKGDTVATKPRVDEAATLSSVPTLTMLSQRIRDKENTWQLDGDRHGEGRTSAKTRRRRSSAFGFCWWC
ncbi:hypothetical protein VITFI_CDS1180 [Vitreoscilla filiformis]|uniref:Uncharacterized protein n=1 Tax=Vitreoscilla filiformis TaxID=63 RepID=A0A221KD56_VITFI|nr:hypothetical protein VITFI_CDS1180 [Vitreoscilla filiformis]